jgi:acyl-CoA thioester hydrolase
MPPQFTRRFRVRHYELDPFGRITDLTLVRYMQEAAIEASAALGFSLDWYRERSALWVVYRLAVRYHAPAAYGEEVEVATWISAMRGVRCTREYHISRVRDGVLVARGRAEWVYVDALTGQPTRCPDGWAEAFPPTGGVEDLCIRLADASPTEGAYRYSSQRRVRSHELDAAQHVNHAAYLRWVEDAFSDALRAAGHPRERTPRDGWRVLPRGHEVQFVAPALEDEPIELVSWLCELGQGCWAWTHEVYNAETHKLLARDYCPAALVSPQDGSTTPQQIIEDVLRGPTR